MTPPLVYLLDTNIISEPTKVEPSFTVLHRMAETLARSCICSITWAEAMTGVQTLVSGKGQDALMKFLVDTIQKNYEIIPFNSSCAMVYAHLVKGLKERGRLGSTFDMMIAACAIANNLILVTRNVADFVPITEIAPLMVENWFG